MQQLGDDAKSAGQATAAGMHARSDEIVDNLFAVLKEHKLTRTTRESLQASIKESVKGDLSELLNDIARGIGYDFEAAVNSGRSAINTGLQELRLAVENAPGSFKQDLASTPTVVKLMFNEDPSGTVHAVSLSLVMTYEVYFHISFLPNPETC